jgi:hypothetical protein
LIVYHRTDHAAAILRDGFRDATDCYMTPNLYTGVWISDSPLDVNEGAEGDVVLTLVIPDALFAEHEWIEEAKTYREALVPAEELNRYRETVEEF